MENDAYRTGAIYAAILTQRSFSGNAKHGSVVKHLVPDMPPSINMWLIMKQKHIVKEAPRLSASHA